MATSIDEARSEVQSTFAAILSYTDSDARQSAWSFEKALFSMLLALGRALMALYFARQAARPRPAEYRHDGQLWVLQGERTTEIGTRFGKVSFTRPIGRRPASRRAACDLPVDRELGLCAGFTLGTVLGMVRLVAQMAYGPARETFRSTYEWTPSPRAVMRMVDATGEEARPFLEQAPAPDDDGEVLVIQVDTKHRQRLRYRDLRRRDLDIGSGAVEGAVRNLIALRLDSAGMRWGRRRSELMLHLRCIVLNGQWDESCEHIASRKGFTLGARPVAAEPYKAAS